MLSNYSQIIVPVDGSEPAANAARFANALGVATGIPVTHLHVFFITPGELVGAARMAQADLEKLRKESAQKAFTAAREAVGHGGHEVQERIVFGEPVDEILAYADAHGPALIVMGRRGLGRVQQLLLGSVSDGVMRNAKGPVTIVS